MERSEMRELRGARLYRGLFGGKCHCFDNEDKFAVRLVLIHRTCQKRRAASRPFKLLWAKSRPALRRGQKFTLDQRGFDRLAQERSK